MRRTDFHFDLPDELIAQYPTENRRDSRLLCLDGNTGKISDEQFATIENYINSGDVLVMNDTRVIPARLFGQKATGGKLEVLVERVLDDSRVLAHIRSSKSPKPGSEIHFDGGISARMLARHDALFELQFVLATGQTVLDILNQVGHMPLPPYISREDQLEDQTRYQTVYGKREGAVAAPTAGLHFDMEMLQHLENKGVEIVYVTLHVGAGTFQPVRVDDITEHTMHAEWIEVTQHAVDKIQQAKSRGGQVVAVGTTSVRCLETAAQFGSQGGSLQAFTGDTRIFITPGFKFKVVDKLLTNFHLPESTLLMLVSAFAGYENIMRAYKHAVNEKYRFFSYGDAMLLTRQSENVIPGQETT